MEADISNYRDLSKDVSTRADGLTSLMTNLVNVPSSRYVPMY